MVSGWVGGWVVGGWVSGWVGGWVGKVWSFLSPLARVFEAQLSSLRQHVVPRTVPTRRAAPDDRDRAPRLPRALRAADGALNKSSEGGLLLRSTSAMPLQQFEGFKREATIVSAELDDEAAVIISCPREGGGGPVQSRRRAPDDKYSPHSQTRLLARPAVLWCLSSPACHPDTEGGAHSSTWAIIWPREGGGGGVGAAASSRWQILASQSKMAARAPGRALAYLSSPACHPDTEGGAHSSTWAIIWPREGGGGGVGAAASSRWQILASQSKMAARAPVRALAYLSSPACHPDTEGGAHSSTWAIIWPREGGGGGVGAAASSQWQMLASQSKMAARAPGRALACLSSPACHPDTEGGAHSSTWAIIWPREGGGGGVGAAASSPVANARLTVQDGGSRPRPCSGVPL